MEADLLRKVPGVYMRVMYGRRILSRVAAILDGEVSDPRHR